MTLWLKENERRRANALRVKFDAVLRKKTQKSSFDQSDNIVIRNNYHKKHK